MFIAKGLDAIILEADMAIPQIRPGGNKMINYNQRMIFWETAPTAMKEDPSVEWRTVWGKKMALRRLTDEEKAEMKLNQAWRIEEMFNYILKKYGWKSAYKFYNIKSWRKKFDDAGFVPNFKIPHCKYEEGGQCDLECPFFKGECVYEEDL
jgi:hypothetical protein